MFSCPSNDSRNNTALWGKGSHSQVEAWEAEKCVGMGEGGMHGYKKTWKEGREDEGIRGEINKLRGIGRGICVKGEEMDGERWQGWSWKFVIPVIDQEKKTVKLDQTPRKIGY